MKDLTRYIPLFDKYDFDIDSRNEFTVNLIMTLFYLNILQDKKYIKGGPANPLTEKGHILAIEMINNGYFLGDEDIRTILKSINTEDKDIETLTRLVERMQQLGPDGMDAAYARMKKIKYN